MINKIKQELINDNLGLALQLILENEERYKDNTSFINMKGILALKAGEYAVAISNLEYALELCKKNKVFYNIQENNKLEIDICYNLALAYENNGDIDKVFTIYKYILNNTFDEDEKLEVKEIMDRIKISSKEKIKKTYSEDNIIDENEYGKVRIRDLSYKEAPPIGNDIYEVRQNLNKLREDDNPLVSIYVLAYNNLEKYTKKCIESILKYTSDVDYELILVDNGSTDGTYEYFKSVNYDKKKVIRINKNMGIGYQAITAFDELKGKYLAFICNDLIVTENWLSNMIKCAESDPKIGMINPVLDYVSNHQSVDLGYTDLEDMQEKAKNYNISNPKKWHERLKLITLGTLFRKECIDMTGIIDYGFIHDYSDDDISFRVRRAGYKAILCKDTFISHIGSYSDKGLDLANISMKKGDDFFKKKYYGIDSRDAMNYELGMLSLVDYSSLADREYNILGIDTLCGTPILEMKNKLREQGKFKTKLKAFSTEAKYWLDLNTICDDVVVDRIDYISEYYNEKFDYIVLGNVINSYKDPYKILDYIIKIVKNQGSILFRLKNNYNMKTLLHILNQEIDTENQLKQNIDIKILNSYLNKKGFCISKIIAEVNNYDKDIENYVDKIIVNNGNYKEVKNKLNTENYILKIESIKK